MSARASDRFIPWYIVAFFVVQAVLFAWFMSLAHDSYPGVVTEKAYDKGLRYNETIARVEQQEMLGWKGSLEAGTSRDGEVRVTLTLRDDTAKPVTGGRVALWFMRPVKSGMDLETEMKEVSPGVYQATTVLPTKGLWDVRVDAVANGKNFQTGRKVIFK